MIIKQYILVHLLIVILQNIMILKEKIDILTDIKSEKTGLRAVLILRDFMLNIFFGVRKQLKNQ